MKLLIWMVFICTLYGKTVILGITLSWALWVVLSNYWIWWGYWRPPNCNHLVRSVGGLGTPELVAEILTEGILVGNCTLNLWTLTWLWVVSTQSHYKEKGGIQAKDSVVPTLWLRLCQGKSSFRAVGDMCSLCLPTLSSSGNSPSPWLYSTLVPGVVMWPRPGQFKHYVSLTIANGSGMDTQSNPIKVNPWTSVGICANKELSSEFVDSNDKISIELLGSHHTERRCQQREENQAERCNKRDIKSWLHHLSILILPDL